jgi:hypothetical protein
MMMSHTFSVIGHELGQQSENTVSCRLCPCLQIREVLENTATQSTRFAHGVVHKLISGQTGDISPTGGVRTHALATT